MRRSAPFVLAALLTGAVACGEKYLHTNPYDPAVPVAVDVVGPDTLFSYSEVGQYAGSSVPAFPDTAFVYASTDSASFTPVGYGKFASTAPPLYPATQTVKVSALLGQIDTIIDNQDITCPFAPPCRSNHCNPFTCVIKATRSFAWRHAGSKDVVLTQRVTSIRLRCPTDRACDTLAVGSAWTVWADGFDALNFPVYSLSGANANPDVSSANPVFATFVVRDTTIATAPSPMGIRVATVTARASGSTWIVATRGALTDSLQLVVR